MMNTFSQNFSLRYYEMNKHGMASPTAILTLLEETAAEHCHQIGYDLYTLESKNVGWVLSSGVIDMVRYPKYKENITIVTWLSTYSLVRGYRENIIYDSDKNIIGRAKGDWVFYDIEKRRPVRIYEEIKTGWGAHPDTTATLDLDLLKPENIGTLEVEFDVLRSDVDANKHVNNIRYFHFMLETLPDEIMDNYFLKNITAKFITEILQGDKLKVYINRTIGENTFLHAMKSHSSDTLIAKAFTQWEKMV